MTELLSAVSGFILCAVLEVKWSDILALLAKLRKGTDADA